MTHRTMTSNSVFLEKYRSSIKIVKDAKGKESKRAQRIKKMNQERMRRMSKVNRMRLKKRAKVY